MNTGWRSAGEGQLERLRAAGRWAAACSSAGADERIGLAEPRDAGAELRERDLRDGEPGTSAAIIATAARDVCGHRPGVVEARREREDAVGRDEPVARLEADDAAAGGGDPDRAARVGAERRLGETGRDRRRRAAARAARGAAGRGRVRDGAVVEVLRGDPVGELVQVRLADVGVAGLLEAGDGDRGLGRARGRRTPPTRTSSGCRPCRTGP